MQEGNACSGEMREMFSGVLPLENSRSLLNKATVSRETRRTSISLDHHAAGKMFPNQGERSFRPVRGSESMTALTDEYTRFAPSACRAIEQRQARASDFPCLKQIEPFGEAGCCVHLRTSRTLRQSRDAGE